MENPFTLSDFMNNKMEVPSFGVFTKLEYSVFVAIASMSRG